MANRDVAANATTGADPAPGVDLELIKQRLCDEVDARAQTLVDISHALHAHPELGFAETFAHDTLTDAIAAEGLDVQRSAYGLDTAFASEAGDRGPTVAVVCEYDALPGLGHACGHNVIAAAGLGAGLAAAALAGEVGGRVRILGTPAEEGGGGKVFMLDAGAFDGCDAAMMVHPAEADLTEIHAIAVQQVVATYGGVAAHAAAAPHQGRNALDAAVLGYVNIGALRQHIRDDERLHGVFTNGGDKPNIVPSSAATHWYVRAANLERLDELRARVESCLRAGADATGCTVELTWLDPAFANLVSNDPLVELYVANAQRLGRNPLVATADTAVTGSTDMGNVSHVVPSIHPMIAVSPPGVFIHTPDFAIHAGGAGGDQAVIDGAKAMAMTVADIWCNPDARQNVRHHFVQSR
jgi:amidohydrolase